MTKPDKPLFDHDCQHCEFLGVYEGTDLYFCGSNATEDNRHATVISRFGSDGPEYRSGLLFAYRPGTLMEAVNRAIAKGLLTQETYDKAIGKETT